MKEYRMTCPRTCADAANIKITQELLDRDSLPWSDEIRFEQKLLYQRMIDDKDVALVFIKNIHDDRSSPYLRCACDFHYEEQEGSRMHYIETHACERKKAWYRERWSEVALEYNKKGLSPREIILDIFDRVVNKSEFLGQTQGDWVFVQNISEVFLSLDPKVWGDEEYPLQKDSILYERVCALFAHNALSVNKDRPLEAHWHPEPPTKKNLAFTHALDLVQMLIDEKKLSLSGMVLVPYREPPPEVLDETRTPMLSWEEKMDPEVSAPLCLVWSICLKKRFHAEVQRSGESTATLCLFYHGRKGKPDRLVKTWKVGLSYGARFGPDVGDVHAWQETLKKFMYANTKQRTRRSKCVLKK